MEQGNEPCAFMLMVHGGMMESIEHPCWEEDWNVPGEITIDELGEFGLLRIEERPATIKRVFRVTPKGRGFLKGETKLPKRPIGFNPPGD